MQKIICCFLFLLSAGDGYSAPFSLVGGVSFEDYKQEIALEDVYIAYVHPSFISPISYFGHNFLVFKKKGSWDFSKVFSFSAVIPAKISVRELITKGAIEHLDGKFVLSNFHQVKYNYLYKEQRGIELYRLLLSEEQKERLLEASFSTYSKDFEYNFFHKNCSSELIKYLGAINPSLRQAQVKHPLSAIELLLRENIIENKPIVYPPQIDVEFHRYSVLDEHERKQVADVLDGGEPADILGDRSIAAVVGQSRLLFNYSRQPLENHVELQKLLYEDDALLDSLPNQFEHLSLGIVGVGHKWTNEGDFTSIRLSPIAYLHSDTRFSRVNETTMVILNSEFKVRGSGVDLEQLDLLELETYNKSFGKLETPSWRFYIGYNDNHYKKGSFQSELAYGASFGTENLLISIMPQLNIDFSNTVVFGQVNLVASYWVGSSNISYNLVGDVFSRDKKGRNLYQELKVSLPLNKDWSLSFMAKEPNNETAFTLNRRFSM